MNDTLARDQETFKKFLSAGLYSGASIALLTTLMRTLKLNKKLREMEDHGPKHDKGTVVISLPDKSAGAMSKSAKVPMVYGITGAVATGLLSYAALDALFRRLEDNRLKKLENSSYDKVVKQIVKQEPDGIKSADWKQTASDLYNGTVGTLGSIYDNWTPTKNVLALLAFLAAWKITKQRLDKNNVDSKNLRPMKADRIMFNRPQKVYGEEGGMALKRANFQFPAIHADGVEDPELLRQLTEIRRDLAQNPDALFALTQNALRAKGLGWLNWLQYIPLVNEFPRSSVLKRFGLGDSYNMYRDPLARVNQTGVGPRMNFSFGSKQDQAAVGLHRLYNQIMRSEDMKKRVAEYFGRQIKDDDPDADAKRVGLNTDFGLSAALGQVGIKPMQGTTVIGSGTRPWHLSKKERVDTASRGGMLRA